MISRPDMDRRIAGDIRFTIAAITIFVTIATTALLPFLIQTVKTSTIPFDSDEANHAVDGWEVYYALVSQTPGALFGAITDQYFYPPIHSFFVAAGYLFAGPSLASSRMPTIVIFALTLLLLVWLTVRIARWDKRGDAIDGWIPLAGATFALALAITSEVFVTMAVLVMLEMTGALFALLLLFIVDSADRTPHPFTHWLGITGAAVATVVVFLTKYSFGLFYLPGLLLGFTTATWPWKAGRHAWLRALAATAICTVLVALWILVIDRTTMWLFFTDHDSDAPIISSENLLYLPRIWFEQYAANYLVAAISISLALIAAVRQWRYLPVRVASWSIVAALGILTISTTNEPRHLLPVVPAIWMLAGIGLMEVLHMAKERVQNHMVLNTGVAGLLVLVAISGVQVAVALPASLDEAFEGDPVLTQMHEFALTHVVLEQPVLLLGDFNDQNNLLAVRWRAALLTNRSLWDLDIDYFPFEQYGHSMLRTHRKPQITDVDSTFFHLYMDDILDQNHFAYFIEVKQRLNYFGPRANNPKDPLCGYSTEEAWFDDWIVIIYDIAAGANTTCNDG